MAVLRERRCERGGLRVELEGLPGVREEGVREEGSRFWREMTCTMKERLL